MDLDAHIRTAALAIARREFAAQLQSIDVIISTLPGGLESAGAKQIVVQARDTMGRAHTLRLVAKHLAGEAAREAAVYRRLLAMDAPRSWPKLFRIDQLSRARAILYLEYVERSHSWPWRDISESSAVLRQLADFHHTNGGIAAALPAWDYDAVLAESAVSTVELLRRMRGDPEFPWVRRSLRSVERLVDALPSRRSELLTFGSFGNRVIHGDLHPGNVIVSERNGRREAVLIDWGRARMGSPLEDVSSWLQTLAYWEPEARRRHDTLLSCYLRASGYEPGLRSEVRDVYWIAAGCNALAGALRYHCWKAGSSDSMSERASAAHAARDWLRIVERACAVSS